MQGVLSAILSWAESQPPWQREALRRLVERGPLSEQDIGELIELCKQAHESHGPITGHSHQVSPQTFPPVVLRTRPPMPAAPVILRRLDDIKNVNALAAGCSLDFGKRGLTVIYGENGSGKSGYARILKRACRARARGIALRANVFEPSPVDPPQARIGFMVGDRDQEFRWVENRPPNPVLGAVSFFDDECAAVHLDSENEVAYRPFGLDLLEDLADACRKVREALRSELEELGGRQAHWMMNPEIAPKTEVARALAGLNADSSLAEFERLAIFSEEEEHRFIEIRSDLGRDPLLVAARIGAQADRLRELLRLIKTAETVAGDAAWRLFFEVRNAASSRRQAAELAATKLFSDEPLPGVGGETWRALWEAARRYSEASAYLGKSFPVHGEAAVCVLCQQDLGVEAADRLRRFEEFVREQTQVVAAAAERVLDERVAEIAALRIVSGNWRHAVAELKSIDPLIAGVVREYLAAVRHRRWLLLRAYHRGIDERQLRDLPLSPVKRLEKLVESVTRRHLQLKAGRSSEVRSLLEAERLELASRRWLRGALPQVQREIDRRRELERLQRADRDADSTPITRKSTEVAQELLTTALVDRFNAELESLQVDNVRVELDYVGGRYGAPRYQIRLRETHDRTIRCGDVLSDGERRVVALAGYLAELATAEEGSALVLDDPVSSLDHRWRRIVAERLAAAAAERQVIVFTHDVVFYLDLRQAAGRLGVDLAERHLRRVGRAAGVPVGNGAPWITMHTKKRIGFLKDRLHTWTAAYRREGIDAWEPHCRDFYGLLRESWERAVEEILLNEAVQRFSHSVQTQRLEKVIVLPDDYEVLKTAMAKCSTAMRGHDEAAAINQPLPEPDEVRRDLVTLEEWVAKIEERRKAGNPAVRP